MNSLFLDLDGCRAKGARAKNEEEDEEEVAILRMVIWVPVLLLTVRQGVRIVITVLSFSGGPAEYTPAVASSSMMGNGVMCRPRLSNRTPTSS